MASTAATVDKPDTGTASGSAAGGDNLRAAHQLKGAVLSVTVYAIGALYLLFNFSLYPGDPTAWYVAAGALAVVGISGVLITNAVVMPMTRATYIAASGLLWPLHIAAMWLLLQFGLQSPNPGSGTALGVFGLVGMMLPRAFALSLRRYELVKRFVPELVTEGQRANPLVRFLVSRPPAEEHSDHWLRDNAESIIIALIMALVIRTFALEAFQIPTGSMKQTLIGVNERTLTTSGFDRMDDAELIDRAIEMLERRSQRNGGDEFLLSSLREDRESGFLRRVNRTQLIEQLVQWTGEGTARTKPVRPGDKILVNKGAYYFGEPQRWDIVVFKYPLNSKRNFIKRLTGLPSEELVIYRGDIWTRPLVSGEPQGQYELQRKPADVQQELWIPIYLMKYAGFTSDVREKDGTLYGIFPLGPAGDATWTEAPLLPYPITSNPGDEHAWNARFDGDWQTFGDWVPTSGTRLPDWFFTSGTIHDRKNESSYSSRAPRRTWWWPPEHEGQESVGAWRVRRAIDSLRKPGDATAPPGFVAETGDDWETIGYTGDIVDRFELPSSREAFDKYDDDERRELQALADAQRSDRYQVGDIRVRCRVYLASEASTFRVVLYNDGERLQLTLTGDGTGDLRRLPHVLRASDPELPADEDAAAQPPQSLTGMMAARGVSIEAGRAFDVAFSNADRRARVSINGVPLEPWDYQPLEEQSPQPGYVDRLPPDGPTTLSLAARNGTVEVGSVNIDRDIHYFLDREMDPVYRIPERRYFVMGDNCHNSKDSRLWNIRTVTLRDDAGNERQIRVEPDPSEDSQHENAVWELWEEKNLNRVNTEGSIGISLLEDDLERFTNAVRQLPADQRVLLLEDVHGVVRKIDLNKERIVSMVDRRAHFVHRRALIGRALLRFWPLDESRFIH